MKDGQPSKTASFVAMWRALGETLPPEARLCRDPLGWGFAPPAVAKLRPLVQRFPRLASRVLLASPLRRLLLWLQLRTRAIDDITEAFAREGGRQIVLLGAGYDSRSVRLASRLGGTSFFEIDHPATQAHKREVLSSAGIDSGAQFVAWDFERDSLTELPSALTSRGFDTTRPSLTIWEGVIPYLTETTVCATLAAVHTYGSAGSRVVLNYIQRRRVESRNFVRFVASRVGEPLRFGWEPAALPNWLEARGFQWLSDHSDTELAQQLFQAPWKNRFKGAGGRVALAARAT
jgi:methyltransferase (TIGR00027 family)